MGEFKYHAPTEIVFGEGMEQNTGELIRKYGGTSVLIVYGGKSAMTTGALGISEDSARSCGLKVEKLGGVVSNPLLSKVYEGIDICKDKGIDFILAIGGGSAIDTAKAIAYGAAEPDKDVWELFSHDRRAKKCLPLGTIVTIAGAGSEMSNSTVITDHRTSLKRSYGDDICRPKFAVLDPALTVSVPDYTAMAGCADIMMHTMERYFTNGDHMEITDSMAEALLRTVKENTLKIHRDPSDIRARGEVMWASSLSHNGLTGCGIEGREFSCHKLEHELGGKYDVAHGAGLTALWGTWARYVVDGCVHRFVRFAEKVHNVSPGFTPMETALKGIEAQEGFFKEIGMPISLRELGIDPSDDDLKEMAASAAMASGGFNGSAKRLYEEDMLNIYRLAL